MAEGESWRASSSETKRTRRLWRLAAVPQQTVSGSLKGEATQWPLSPQPISELLQPETLPDHPHPARAERPLVLSPATLTVMCENLRSLEAEAETFDGTRVKLRLVGHVGPQCLYLATHNHRRQLAPPPFILPVQG